MGKSSNFATVPARLIVDGKDRGIQMFIVQLRDLQTHQPMPGIFMLTYFIILIYNVYDMKIVLYRILYRPNK